MKALSIYKDRLNMVDESKDATRTNNACNKVSLGTTTLVLEKAVLPLEVRKEKILTIRNKLIEGKYDLDERLNLALDKFIEDLLT